MNARLILSRSRVGIHPGFVRAVELKLDLPAEIYAYPAQSRREAPNPRKPPKVPDAPQADNAMPSLGWLQVAYAVILLTLWVVGANVTPGA